MLQGSLDSFGFEEVAMFLAATQKTGRLDLDGDRRSGSLWFVDGDVVAAVASDLGADAAVADVTFELLRCAWGEFAFLADEVAPAPGPAHEMAALLDQVGQALAEWHELAAIVPSEDHRITLVADAPLEPVVLDAGQWRLVAALSGGATVAELGPALGGELAALRLVRDLAALGLVEVDPAPAPPLAPAAEAHPGTVAPPSGSSGPVPASGLGGPAAPPGYGVVDRTDRTDRTGAAGGAPTPPADRFDDGILLSLLPDER